MKSILRNPWIVATGTCAVAIAVLVAVILARTEKPSRALIAATPQILAAGQGTAPEIAALNAQLGQIAALKAGALYGVGLTHVVRGPIQSLRPILGEEWRELHSGPGSVSLKPTGQRGDWFEVSMVVVSQGGPARIEVLTSAEQRVMEPIGGGPFRVLNLGPLIVPKSGPINLALTSLASTGDEKGPALTISPLQAEYLSPGTWMRSMPALSEEGPGGQRGVYLDTGTTTPFAITPGVRCPCDATLQAASVGGPVAVTIAIGGASRRATVPDKVGAIRLGPFATSPAVVSVAPSSTTGAKRYLFLSDLALVPVAAEP